MIDRVGEPLTPEYRRELVQVADDLAKHSYIQLPLILSLIYKLVDAEAYWRNVVVSSESVGGGRDGYPTYCTFCGVDDDTLLPPTSNHAGTTYIKRFEQQELETALFTEAGGPATGESIHTRRHAKTCPYVLACQYTSRV